MWTCKCGRKNPSNNDCSCSKAKEILEKGCELYCRWYDTGQPAMDGSNMAYELVSFMRQALAHHK